MSSAYMDTAGYRVNRYAAILRVLGLSDREGRIHVVNDIALTLNDLEAMVREHAAMFEALEAIVAKDRRQMFERCPDGINNCSTKCGEAKECQLVPLSVLGQIATAALKPEQNSACTSGAKDG